MTVQLTESINQYFEISNGVDTARAKECFTPDATVHDEGGTYQGLAAIESWLQETRTKYQFSSKPISITKKELQDIVVAEVSGTFPGSPIKLNYAFVLNSGKIQSLKIS